jgi:hypothetical protein
MSRMYGVDRHQARVIIRVGSVCRRRFARPEFKAAFNCTPLESVLICVNNGITLQVQRSGTPALEVAPPSQPPLLLKPDHALRTRHHTTPAFTVSCPHHTTPCLHPLSHTATASPHNRTHRVSEKWGLASSSVSNW